MISVIGAGGVGGLLAALLERAGIEVRVVAREATSSAIREHGIEVRSEQFGDFRVRPQTAAAPPPGSAAILAVKHGGLAAALTQLAGSAPREVVSLLNGVSHAAALRDALAPACRRLAAASISVVSARQGTLITHTSPFTIVKVPDGAAPWDIPRALREAGVSCSEGGSEPEVLWAKFRFLAPMALLTASSDLPIGDALAQNPALTERLTSEIAALASAEGLPTEAAQVRSLLEKAPPAAMSSLSLDIRRGERGELDALGYALVDIAQCHGIPAPTIGALTEAITARLRGGGY